MLLRYIIIKVKNLQRAKEFYVKLLEQEPYKEEVDRIVVFKLENIKIGLYNPLADGDVVNDDDFWTNCRPAWWTHDLPSELDRISHLTTITNQHTVDSHERFEFEDSEGNILEVHKI